MSTVLSRLATPMVRRNCELPRAYSPGGEYRDGRHARIIPAADRTFLHQLQQPSLAHNRIGEIETGKLDLLRMAGNRQLLEKPVIQRPVVFKLKGADRMGNLLDASEMQWA